MEFKKASYLSSLLAKDYAEDFFKLLVNYQDISASEAASRLSLHIRTAQDFLDGLTEAGLLTKKEVHEKKRPYFRYTLNTQKISFEVDLNEFAKEDPGEGLNRLIRETAHSRSNFAIARSGDHFSAITIWEGEGREQKERKISLTTPQGKFLFHLPFPQSRPQTIADVMEKAEIETEYSSEIQNIVDELANMGVIEFL
jgi:predicted transcriptional regulator